MTAQAKAIEKVFNFSNRKLYNERYLETWHNDVEFLHYFGSAGSGKSRFVAQKEIVFSFREQRRNRKTLVVRKVFNTIKESVYSELKTVIYSWKLDDVFEILKTPLQITNKETGVTFLFIGLDDVEKVKSISGVDRIWIEEATELTSPTELDQLRLRLRGFDKVQITLSYNPINVHHWLNTDIHEKRPEGHYIFKTTYRDNVKMLEADPHYADYIESLQFTNPNYYKVYGLGEWGQNLEGLIYPDYDSIDAMPGEPQFYGLDFGFNDPCALVAGRIQDIFEQPKKDYIIQEILYETGHTSATLIARFASLGVCKRIPMICDNARPEMIADLKRAGYNVRPCLKYAGSVRDGINAMKKYRIRIVAGSKNTFREFGNYVWADKDGRILDEPAANQVDHACDGSRYGLEAVRKQAGKFYSA
jgi:phage terminase large subunit